MMMAKEEILETGLPGVKKHGVLTLRSVNSPKSFGTRRHFILTESVATHIAICTHKGLGGVRRSTAVGNKLVALILNVANNNITVVSR